MELTVCHRYAGWCNYPRGLLSAESSELRGQDFYSLPDQRRTEPLIMDKTEYHAIDGRFRTVFNRYAAQLSKEGRENVEHFIEAAEVEMACESFVLSVLEEHVPLASVSKKELLALTLALQLDKESVFRSDFWKIASTLLTSRD